VYSPLKGAVDFYAEDWYKVASFKGFKEQPTQHYIQPLIQAMDQVRPSSIAVEYTLKFLQNHNVPISKVSAMCLYGKLLTPAMSSVPALNPVNIGTILG
jgi:hypothetical protein